MRQNIALLIIGVVVLAGIAGVLAMTMFNATNQTNNTTVNNTTVNDSNNNTTKNKDDTANPSSSQDQSTDGNDDGNIDNDNNNGEPSGQGHYVTCPECGGSRWIPGTNQGGSGHRCYTCNGRGEIWVPD